MNQKVRVLCKNAHAWEAEYGYEGICPECGSAPIANDLIAYGPFAARMTKVQDLRRGDVLKLPYPYGVVIVRDVRVYSRPYELMFEVDYGIRSNDVQGTLHYQWDEEVDLA